MEATLTNEIATTLTTSKEIVTNKKYKKSDSKEFFVGVFYILKKVFLLA